MATGQAEQRHTPQAPSPSWRWLLVVAMLFVIATAGYLLTLTFLTQKRLQESAIARIEEDLSERTRDLYTYLYERKSDLQELAQSTVIESYFVNKSLGMSEEYGLKGSRNLILKQFEQHNRHESPGWHSNYARLVLFSVDGQVLVSYQASPPFQIQTWDWTNIVSDGRFAQPQALIDPENPDYFLITSPVKRLGDPMGHIAGWIPVSSIQNHYLLTEEEAREDGQSFSDAILLVIDKTFWFSRSQVIEGLKHLLSKHLAEASWKALSHDPQKTGAERTHFVIKRTPELPADYMVVASRLPNDDILLLRLLEQTAIMDPQGPLRLVLSLGLVCAATVTILWLAVRQQTRAKLLESQLEETNRQQQEIGEANLRLQQEVAQRRQAELIAERERQRLELVVYSTDAGIWEWFVQTGETIYNERWAEIIGYTLAELAPISIRTWETLCHPEDMARSEHLLRRHFNGEFKFYDCECRIRHKHGHWVWVHDRGRVVEWNDNGTPKKMSGTLTDITRRKVAELELIAAKTTLEQRVEERTRDLAAVHSQMVMREKMASIGQLAAGIAHEINNPINFVRTNFATLTDNFADLATLITQYREALDKPDATFESTARTALQQAAKDLNLDFLLADIPELFRETEKGFTRIGKIIQAMRDFSRTEGGDNYCRANINKGIEDTLTIARNEYRYHAEVETEYGNLPEVMCIPEQLNQVFLNLVVNSSQAIAEAGTGRGTIHISTRQDGDSVLCRIWDNGAPIPENLKYRLFEPFFTTKPPGQGTGLGLSISYDIVVHKHGGEIFIETPAEGGKAFVIRLPIEQRQEE